MDLTFLRSINRKSYPPRKNMQKLYSSHTMGHNCQNGIWDLGFGTGPHVEGGISSAQFLLSSAFSARSLHKVLEHAVSLIFPDLTGPFHESCLPEPHLHCMRDNPISWTENPRQAGGRAQAGRQGWCGCVRALARGRRTWVGRAGGAAGPAEQGERAVAKS